MSAVTQDLRDIVRPMTDRPRPAHLTAHNADTFQLEGVVEAYHLRPPYPPELAAFLVGLMAPKGGAVLELGCGTGEITRVLAPHVERIDAIDVSAPMLARARGMSGGGHAAIRWILGRAEDVDFDGPYALAVSGDALHWMEWDVVLPKIGAALAPGAHLAIVSAKYDAPWLERLLDPIVRYSAMQDFERYDLVEQLAARGLFETIDERTPGPMGFTRTVDEYIEALHATAGLARERMGPENAAAFDGEVRAIVAPYAADGVLRLEASAHVVWGSPG
jgi:SAM-dependent methyltransferase